MRNQGSPARAPSYITRVPDASGASNQMNSSNNNFHHQPINITQIHRTDGTSYPPDHHHYQSSSSSLYPISSYPVSSASVMNPIQEYHQNSNRNAVYEISNAPVSSRMIPQPSNRPSQHYIVDISSSSRSISPPLLHQNYQSSGHFIHPHPNIQQQQPSRYSNVTPTDFNVNQGRIQRGLNSSMAQRAANDDQNDENYDDVDDFDQHQKSISTTKSEPFYDNSYGVKKEPLAGALGHSSNSSSSGGSKIERAIKEADNAAREMLENSSSKLHYYDISKVIEKVKMTGIQFSKYPSNVKKLVEIKEKVEVWLAKVPEYWNISDDDTSTPKNSMAEVQKFYESGLELGVDDLPILDEIKSQLEKGTRLVEYYKKNISNVPAGSKSHASPQVVSGILDSYKKLAFTIPELSELERLQNKMTFIDKAKALLKKVDDNSVSDAPDVKKKWSMITWEELDDVFKSGQKNNIDEGSPVFSRINQAYRRFLKKRQELDNMFHKSGEVSKSEIESLRQIKEPSCVIFAELSEVEDALDTVAWVEEALALFDEKRKSNKQLFDDEINALEQDAKSLEIRNSNKLAHRVEGVDRVLHLIQNFNKLLTKDTASKPNQISSSSSSSSSPPASEHLATTTTSSSSKSTLSSSKELAKPSTKPATKHTKKVEIPSSPTSSLLSSSSDDDSVSFIESKTSSGGNKLSLKRRRSSSEMKVEYENHNTKNDVSDNNDVSNNVQGIEEESKNDIFAESKRIANDDDNSDSHIENADEEDQTEEEEQSLADNEIIENYERHPLELHKFRHSLSNRFILVDPDNEQEWLLAKVLYYNPATKTHLFILEGSAVMKISELYFYPKGEARTLDKKYKRDWAYTNKSFDFDEDEEVSGVSVDETPYGRYQKARLLDRRKFFGKYLLFTKMSSSSSSNEKNGSKNDKQSKSKENQNNTQLCIIESYDENKDTYKVFFEDLHFDEVKVMEKEKRQFMSVKDNTLYAWKKPAANAKFKKTLEDKELEKDELVKAIGKPIEKGLSKQLTETMDDDASDFHESEESSKESDNESLEETSDEEMEEDDVEVVNESEKTKKRVAELVDITKNKAKKRKIAEGRQKDGKLSLDDWAEKRLNYLIRLKGEKKKKTSSSSTGKTKMMPTLNKITALPPPEVSNSSTGQQGSPPRPESDPVRNKNSNLLREAVEAGKTKTEDIQPLVDLVEREIYNHVFSKQNGASNSYSKEQLVEEYKNLCRQIKTNLKNTKEPLSAFLHNSNMRKMMIETPKLKIDDILEKHKSPTKQSGQIR